MWPGLPPIGVKAKLSTISKRQFLTLEGDFEQVVGLIAQLLHSTDWHLLQRTPAERLEIQRRVDLNTWRDDDD